jgi:hypothetical protein
MVWLLERGDTRVVCEIRRSESDDTYEFELARPGQPPVTELFECPSQLIDAYLKKQSLLRAEGYRPRVVEVPMFS